MGTPLSTVANYASLLEGGSAAKPDDVRAFARRIKSAALCSAAMLRHVADAIALSERAIQEPIEIDPSDILGTLLAESSVRGEFAPPLAPPSERIPFDGELLEFAWRAFVAINAHAADHPREVHLAVQRIDGEFAITLQLGTESGASPNNAGPSAFCAGSDSFGVQESCLALGLAEQLIVARGGTFELSGRPGRFASLRIAYPAPG